MSLCRCTPELSGGLIGSLNSFPPPLFFHWRRLHRAAIASTGVDHSVAVTETRENNGACTQVLAALAPGRRNAAAAGRLVAIAKIAHGPIEI